MTDLIAATFRMLCDSLAGYLLIIVITSGLPILSKLSFKFTPAQIKSFPLKVHPTLPDLQEFNPIECLVLYLMAYPALAMYRSGGVLGYLTLSVGLVGVLGGVIGPATLKYQEEDLEKKEQQQQEDEATVKSGGGLKEKEVMIKKKEKTGEDIVREPKSTLMKKQESVVKIDIFKKGTPATSEMSSTLTADTNVPVLQDEARSVQDSSLLKEMDGNLIDSNLEPHYSNLIDSANAPIFGVDSEGVSLDGLDDEVVCFGHTV